MAKQYDTIILYHAHFQQVYGTALRDHQGAVWFVAQGDRVPTLLHNVDVPDLDLHGRMDLAAEAALADGDLVAKCSQTLQEVAA